MSLQPHLSPSNTAPAVPHTGHILPAVAERPVFSTDLFGSSVPGNYEAGCWKTVYLPPDKQLIMLPISIPFLTNTTIAPVQFPSPIGAFGGFEAPGILHQPQSANKPMDGGSNTTTTLHSEIVASGTKRLRDNSQSKRRSIHSISSTADSDTRGTSFQVGEPSTGVITRSRQATSHVDTPDSDKPVELKKTPNAFILFRGEFHKAYNARLAPDEKPLSVSMISPLASKAWKSMTPEEKRPYEEKAEQLRKEYMLAKAQIKEDEKVRKRASKRKRKLSNAQTQNKRINTSRVSSSSFRVPPPPMAGFIGGMPEFLPQSTAAFINTIPGIPLPQAYMPADTDYLTAGASIQGDVMNSISDHPSIISGNSSFTQSSVLLPASMLVPTSMHAVPTSYISNQSLYEHIPQRQYSFDSATLPGFATPAPQIDQQSGYDLTSINLYNQAAQRAAESLSFANPTFPHMPLTTAESNTIAGQPAYTQSTSTNAISSALSTVDTLDIPASLSGLNSAIMNLLSPNAATCTVISNRDAESQ